MSIVNDDNSDIFNLFVVPLGWYNMDFKFSKDELEFLQNQEFDKNEGNLTSKDDFILEREQLKRVRKWIDDCIVHYFDKTYCFVKNELYITQSWTNLSKPGMFHHRHNHGNSLISGVMYIEGNDDDKIVNSESINLLKEKSHKYRKIQTSNNIIKRGILETIFGGIGADPMPNSP